MKTKLVVLLSIIILPTCYSIWKNSTMVEVDFDDLYDQVELVTIGSNPENNFKETPTDKVPYVISQYDEKPDTIEELYEASDIVAIIKPVSRKQEISVVNTMVEIKKSFKSEYQIGQKISLFEQYYLRFDTYEGEDYTSLIASEGYIPMDMNKEYLVFLKKSPKYTTDQFGFISLLYGRFPYITDDPKILELESSYQNSIRDITIEEVNEQDVILFNLANDETDSMTELQKKQRGMYEQYKENYLQILQDLIKKNYELVEGKL